MTRLPATHPSVHQHVLHRGFSVQLSPVEQTIEKAVNKNTITAGNKVLFPPNIQMPRL